MLFYANLLKTIFLIKDLTYQQDDNTRVLHN